MKNKGFTLIELLAVIVILAIIALIAVPIIINIINESRESSNQRSVELYGKAVENAIMQTQLTKEVPIGNYTSSNDGKTLTYTNNSTTPATVTTINVQYSGSKVVCTTNTLYSDGKVYLAGCKVGNDTKEYRYGEEQQPEPQDTYAYLTTGSSGDGPNIGDDASSLSTEPPSDTNYYLKFKLDDTNKVTNAYACAKFDGQEYCIEGGNNAAYYGWVTDKTDSTGNVKILYDIELADIPEVSCSFSASGSNCNDGSVYLYAYPTDYVRAGQCYIYDGGTWTYCG